MTIALTALQVIIGLIFLSTGSIKMFIPREQLPSKGVTGFENIAPRFIKWLGTVEIAGALILLLFSIPSLPKLPIRIVVSGFTLLMLAASYHHLKRKEWKNMVVTLILLGTCLIILYFK
jgi:hypothetical protein